MIDKRFYQSTPPVTLQSIVQMTGATINSNLDHNRLSSILIDSLAPLDLATNTQLACFHNLKYLSQLKHSCAAACFMKSEDTVAASANVIPLVTPHPYRAFGIIAQALYPYVDKDFENSTSSIHSSARIGSNCVIEYGCVIHKNAQIGDYTRIGANSVIGPGVIIGNNCTIESNVVIKYSIIGNDITILAGTCIGQAGFGFFMDEKGHIKIPQLGRVIIGNNVEIGANVTIDRGSLKDTVIGSGCRIDNLVQIAHNVVLGKGCIVVAQVGIAGSTELGDHVIAAGQVGIAGHLRVGHHVKIAAQSGIMRDIADGDVVAGSPAVPVKQWHRQTVALQNLAKRKGS